MKKCFFSTLLAAAMLASCSSDEPGGSSTDNANGGQGGFIALNICAPTSTAGRATDGGYEVGSDGENAASKGIFLLFDGNGDQAQTAQEIELTWEPANDPADPAANREKISEAVLVINGQDKDHKPSATEILVVLNSPYKVSEYANKTKTEVLELVNDCSAHGDGEFVMSNSVYSANCAAEIGNHIMHTEAAAKANPVDIYVERVLAKVRTSGNAGSINNNNGVDIEIVGQSTKHLTIDITGIEVANKPNRSYLFKHGFDAWSAYAGAVDAANFRSYWATSAESTDGFLYDNQSYNDMITAYGKLDKSKPFVDYVQENTIQSTDDVDNSGNQTCILVTAQLKDADGNGFTFVSWGGKKWLQDGFGANAANVIRDKFRVKKEDASSAQYNTLPADAFAWLDSANHPANYEVWENTMRVKTKTDDGYDLDGTLVKKNSDGTWSDATIDEVNAYLVANLKVLMWNEGRAYYYVPIESFLLDGTSPRIGVVRNHIYELTLEKIEGVGVPVWDPNQDIFPKRPDEDDLFYLAARVNILKWKVAKQTVNFE